VLDDVAVTMEAEGWLHVITWLSWGKGAPPDSPAAFARADGSHAQRFAGGMARLHLQPDNVCLNYVAWNDSILPLGLTFTVEYTLGFRVFRTSLP
jgi:hypothetical protein